MGGSGALHRLHAGQEKLLSERQLQHRELCAMARQPEARRLQLMPRWPLACLIHHHAHECRRTVQWAALWPCIAAADLMASTRIMHGNTKHLEGQAHAQYNLWHSRAKT